MMGKASLCFGFLTIALLCYGGFRYAVDTDPRAAEVGDGVDSSGAAPLRVLDAVKDLGEKPSQDVRVGFRVQNKSARSVRVVGIPPGCGQNCCVEPVCMDPFVLAAGEEKEIECIAHAGTAGPFQCPIRIAYHDGDYQLLEMSVRGTWIAPNNVLPKPRELDSH